MALTDLINTPLKRNIKPVLKSIDIDDIKTNKYNFYDIRDIEELSLNIKENGLYKPLEVYYDQEQEVYILLGGERRYHALLPLVENDYIDADIACMVYKTPTSVVNEKLQIITSNAQRLLTHEEKQKIVSELVELVKLDPSLKPKDMKLRDYIASFLGCSPRTVQQYLSPTPDVPSSSDEPTSSKPKKRKQKEQYQIVAEDMLREILRTKIDCTNKKLTITFNGEEELKDIFEKLGLRYTD